MKKPISLLLAGVMALGTVGTAFATTDAGNGTVVSYTGTGSEAYTITVPATLTPSSNGDVEANGTWASNRKLVVTAPETVTLTNDISGADEKVLDVTFAGIAEVGNNNEAITVVENIAVGEIKNALFGKWSGKIIYTVSMEDYAGPVRMLDGDGQTVNLFALSETSFRSSAPMDELQEVQVNGETVDPANYEVLEGSTIIKFKNDYASNLTLGSNTIDIVSDSGTASGTFTVVNEVPDDVTMYEGATYNGVEIDMSSATEIASEDLVGRTPVEGDLFEYGDYKYLYYPLESPTDGGWWVWTKDNTKSEYGEILTKIAGQSVISMEMTFCNHANLITAPAIPDSVVRLTRTFEGCTALTGTITINANPREYNYYDTFKDTAQPIVLTGSSTKLHALVGTATNGNVSVDIPFDPAKTEISLAEYGGVAPAEGDGFVYGDYKYEYSGMYDNGWHVSVLDKTKTEYGIILTNIAGVPITDMNSTFAGCTNLVIAPEVPNGVLSLWSTFEGCVNLTTAPTIPSSVNRMPCAFKDCTSLTGTITINANPMYGDCFAGTTQPIVLTGSSTILADCAADATNGNVTVQQ
jgi:hypothetical protein